MDNVVDLAAYRKQKADEAHEKEMAEIASLRAELSEYLEELGDIETGPFRSEDEMDAWAHQAVTLMVTALDGYTGWPIDSSDM